MKTYVITTCETHYCRYWVEAEDKEQAMDMFENGAWTREQTDNSTTDDVQIKEEK